ncbi:MAG: DUF350 domain-containing protein [Microthrixaceae bacterium]|nr:DUF350 domain-containing protein [Acidimicrobiales bacterium]MCB9403410.1 DUF350 domain-containing protein [Microthrixaceae bacterium]
MEDFINDLGPIAAWLGVSLALMVVGFIVIDVLTPGNLRAQVSENMNAALLVAGKLTAVGIIVGGAVLASPDALDEGLVQAALYGMTGILASSGVFLLLDAALPVKLRELVGEDRFDPAAVVAMGSEIAVALVIAAALS